MSMDITKLDPMILAAAGTAIIGIAAVVTLYSKKSTNEVSSRSETKATSNTKSAAKKKSKSKKNISKADKQIPKNEFITEVDTSIGVISSNSQAVKFEVNEEEPTVYKDASSNDMHDDIVELVDEKKVKKPKESAEQKAARLARQKIAKASKSAEDSNTLPDPKVQSSAYVNENYIDGDELANFINTTNTPAEGWAVVEDKRKQKDVKKPAESIPVVVEVPEVVAPVQPSAPVDKTTAEIMVDGKKVGSIIGQKGATLRTIQESTGTEITIPKDRDAKTVPIVISGPAEGVASATKCINDLVNKGYSGLLEGDDFSEGHVSINPMFLSDVIGKGGCIRKALQDSTGVRITIPPGASRDQPNNVKIGLAGNRAKVIETKRLIKELIQYYHTPVTHPGVVHEELEIPSNMYNYIIGKGGSEIKHIQNNFKVNVYIPGAHSLHKNVLVVGQPTAVHTAARYIERKIEQTIKDRLEREQNNGDKTRRNGNTPAEAVDDEPHEEWMNEYIHPSKRIQKPETDVFPNGSTPANAPMTQPAWKNTVPSALKVGE